MLTENDVVDSVCEYLEAEGFTIESKCSTELRGVDIVAVRGEKRLFIEAKGATSSKTTSKRFGNEFDSNQVTVHVSRALYAAVKYTEIDQVNAAMAFPKNAAHETCVQSIAPSLLKLGITVFWVDTAGKVTLSGAPISAVELDDRVADVRVTDDALEVRLRDGRRISAPLTWFPTLAGASAAQRANWEPAAAGHGIHWPDLDEDLSVAGLLRSVS